MSLILVEGAESTGKSTLINKLSKLGITEMEFDRAVQNINESAVVINSRVDKTNEQIIDLIFQGHLTCLDRGFLSSQVYGEIYKRAQKDYIKEFYTFRNKGLLVIYCFCDKETASKRLPYRKKITSAYNKDWQIISECFERNVIRMIKMGFNVIKINTSVK